MEDSKKEMTNRQMWLESIGFIKDLFLSKSSRVESDQNLFMNYFEKKKLKIIG